MDPFYGDLIDEMVKDCIKQRKELDQIVEKHLGSTDRFKNSYKKRRMLLDLSILMWNAIFNQLENKLRAYPVG